MGKAQESLPGVIGSDTFPFAWRSHRGGRSIQRNAERLVDFVKTHPVAHVLGTHIEQGSQAYFDYPRGTTYQPKEHVLELSRAHVFELNEAFEKMNGKPLRMVYPDFAVVPRGSDVPLPPTIQAGDGLDLQTGSVPKDWQSGGTKCPACADWYVNE